MKYLVNYRHIVFSYFLCISLSAQAKIDVKCSYQVNPSSFDTINFANELEPSQDGKNKLKPGDTVCFEPGEYPSIALRNLIATKSAPITLRSMEEGTAHISLSEYKGTSISIVNSRFIQVEGFKVSGGLYGIKSVDSANISIINNSISNVGQEAILATVDRCDIKSEFYKISSNRIDVTGQNNPQYGEGIYIGSGRESDCGIESVIIKGNTISKTTNEAIEIKYNVIDVLIENNEIFDIDLAFNGVITLSTSEYPKSDGNYKVISNKIYDFSNRNGYSVSAIAVGNGDAVIMDNFIENDDGFFVYIYESINKSISKDVLIERNKYIGGVKRIHIAGNIEE